MNAMRMQAIKITFSRAFFMFSLRSETLCFTFAEKCMYTSRDSFSFMQFHFFSLRMFLVLSFSTWLFFSRVAHCVEAKLYTIGRSGFVIQPSIRLQCAYI